MNVYKHIMIYRKMLIFLIGLWAMNQTMNTTGAIGIYHMI
jgi:hypothetical protein